jgi:hypothetical protein
VRSRRTSFWAKTFADMIATNNKAAEEDCIPIFIFIDWDIVLDRPLELNA